VFSLMYELNILLFYRHMLSFKGAGHFGYRGCERTFYFHKDLNFNRFLDGFFQVFPFLLRVLFNDAVNCQDCIPSVPSSRAVHCVIAPSILHSTLKYSAHPCAPVPAGWHRTPAQMLLLSDTSL
jgi:hypothetical protein